jgi:23S rRNA (guanosine2251-2'-O)-methyltransferase
MNKRPIVIIAHNMRSLWNVGSLFRSADAFSIEHIHLTGYTAAPPRVEISKTALGSEEWIPWSKDLSPEDIIQKRRQEGFEIVSLECTDTSTDIGLHMPIKPICLILGHEVLGVSDELLTLSDRVVHIPMLGKKSSLNVSVAAGISLYHYRC